MLTLIVRRVHSRSPAFKKMMVKRNVELEVEALRALQQSHALAAATPFEPSASASAASTATASAAAAAVSVSAPASAAEESDQLAAALKLSIVESQRTEAVRTARELARQHSATAKAALAAPSVESDPDIEVCGGGLGNRFLAGWRNMTQ